MTARSTHLKELEYNGLKLSFHGGAKDPRGKKKNPLASQLKLTQEETRPGDLILDEETQDILNDIEAENVMIHDPAEYERRLLDERVFASDVDQGELSGRGTEARGS